MAAREQTQDMLTMPTGPWTVFLRWGFGFVLASFLIWPVSTMFLDSECENVWDPAVQEYVLRPDQRFCQRTEGWAVTQIGKHGILGTADIETIQDPIVAFWGDSYVEALHVPDEAKMAAQFTRACRARTRRPLVGVNIGYSGRNVADYYSLIPAYERVAPSIVCHVIVVGHFEDILPDRFDGRSNRFVSRPQPAFVHHGWKPRWQKIKGALDSLNLQFVWRLAVDLTELSVRLRPGPVPAPGNEDVRPDGDLGLQEAWSFLITAMRQRTDRPLLFVYLADVPKIENGRVRLDNPEQRRTELFGDLCRRHGVGFIDMTEDFVRLYKTKGKLARGFANGIPGRGHINADGHRLVAEAVLLHLANGSHGF